MGISEKIAKVEPLITTRALSGPFDYLLTERLGEVEVGSVLEVPFGRQRLLGVVTGMATESAVPAEKLVEPLRVLSLGVPAPLVSLGLQLAREYSSTPARGLSLVLPPGIAAGSRAPRARERRRLVAEITAAGSGALAGDGSKLGDKQRAALVELASGPLPVSELCAAVRSGHSLVRRLQARGLAEVFSEGVHRRPQSAPVGPLADRPSLNGGQAGALGRIVEALQGRGGASGRFLLQGVTGSGKTEVYLRAVEEATGMGRSAIVLVPEIGLTPQTVGRFRHRFGESVAVLHSKMGLGERYDEWRRMAAGEATICVGPRSALFAPLKCLGIIVIDEEHDHSYKQESDPRYDARRAAEIRAELEGAVVVAGSATPRSESRLAMERLVLDERVDGRRLPPVEVVDMRGCREHIHTRTREALEQVRERGQKAIVLLNRRGWASFLSCRECGAVQQCPNCDVSLTLHSEAGGHALVCHHCGYSEPAQKVCPGCGSAAVARHGIGTEQLQAELERLLAPMAIFRLDADAARTKGGTATVLSRFDSCDSGVLIGTQMVAKGHDFPDVTLGVVVDADSTLRLPNFRAEERAFALIAQLAGRSGRGSKGGKVIVQTLAPEEPSILYAAAHDSEGFLREELARREALSYPPYSTLARIVTADRNEQKAVAAAQEVNRLLRGGEVDVLGPAPLFRLRGFFRSQILIKGRRRPQVVDAVGEAVAALVRIRSYRGVKVVADIDPQ